MSSLDIFRTADAEYEVLRGAGTGFQNVCEWIDNDASLPFQARIAEISRLCISEHKFNFDDFLYVIESELVLAEGNERKTLKPGDTVHIKAGSTVIMDLRGRSQLLWVTGSPSGDWRDGNENYTAPMERTT